MEVTDKPKKRQLTMFDFDIFDQSTESSSHVKKQHCYVDANHSQPAEWFDNRICNPDESREQEVSIYNDEEIEELDTEVSTAETNTFLSSQTTQSTASSGTSVWSNVVIEDIAISSTVSPVQPRCIDFLLLLSVVNHGVLVLDGMLPIVGWNFKLEMMLCFAILVICLHVGKEKQKRLSVSLVTKNGSMQEKH